MFYNCTVLMILIGLMNYHYSGVPGLVGANARTITSIYFQKYRSHDDLSLAYVLFTILFG